MIWKINYINLYLAERKKITSKNIESLSSKQVMHMGDGYNIEYWNHFKKYVFFKWFDENYIDDFSFVKRVEKLSKKLDLVLNDVEEQKIYNLLPREFTSRRSKKVIEVPYTNNIFKNNLKLNNKAYFFYKEVKVFSMSKIFLKKKYEGEIYLTQSEIVFYDKKNKQILDYVYFKEIENISYKSFATIIKLKNGKDLNIKYIDNKLIYMSLKRSIHPKFKVEFNETINNELKQENFLEMFLNL